MPASDQGVSADRYLLIPRTLIFLTSGDRVLLLKGAPHKRLWAGQYNGIGGHIERGEGVLAAARRELSEEAGLAVDGLFLCGTIVVNTGQEIGVGIYVLKAECAGQQPLRSQEGTPEWLPVAGLDQLPLVEDLPVILPRVLSMQPGAAPFSAYSFYNESGRLMMQFD